MSLPRVNLSGQVESAQRLALRGHLLKQLLIELDDGVRKSGIIQLRSDLLPRPDHILREIFQCLALDFVRAILGEKQERQTADGIRVASSGGRVHDGRTHILI